MGISEKKMQIVINNYFKQECDVNTSIREAFEKGFRIGIKKASSAQLEPLADVIRPVRCRECKHWHKAMTEDGVEMINFSHCKKGHHGDGLTWFCADGERK